MTHEVGHTRPRPDPEDQRARINDEKYRKRIGLGLVGPDNLSEQLGADPDFSVIPAEQQANLAATDLRKRGGGAPVGVADTLPPGSGADVVSSSPPAEPVPYTPREGNVYTQADVPMLTERANQQLQVLPPGVSPFGGGFSRPGAIPASVQPDRERERLEQAVKTAMNSKPQLQYGQSIYSNINDRPDLRLKSLDAHAARLQAGNAADAQLNRMDDRGDAQAAGTKVVRDANGNAFFVNPITQQVTPANTPDGSQLTIPQDPRAYGRPTALAKNVALYQRILGVDGETALGMANTLRGMDRTAGIFRAMQLIKPQFGNIPEEELRERATLLFDQIQTEGGQGQGGDMEAEIRRMAGDFK